MGANIKILSLGDIVRRGWNVEIECQCGHKGVVDAAKMDRWYMCHMWPTGISALRDHLYCLGCGGMPPAVRIRATAAAPNTARGRFPANEEGWKRLVRGLRG